MICKLTATNVYKSFKIFLDYFGKINLIVTIKNKFLYDSTKKQVKNIPQK